MLTRRLKTTDEGMNCLLNAHWRGNRSIALAGNGELQIGYKLASEKFSAPELVRQAAAAEKHGFQFAVISGHFHPWTNRQGESPVVWDVLGGIGQVTSKLIFGTGVTCPTFRIHPTIVAQAAATAATMMPGRFFSGGRDRRESE